LLGIKPALKSCIIPALDKAVNEMIDKAVKISVSTAELELQFSQTFSPDLANAYKDLINQAFGVIVSFFGIKNNFKIFLSIF
jgi:hypothetical protein